MVGLEKGDEHPTYIPVEYGTFICSTSVTNLTRLRSTFCSGQSGTRQVWRTMWQSAQHNAPGLWCAHSACLGCSSTAVCLVNLVKTPVHTSQQYYANDTRTRNWYRKPVPENWYHFFGHSFFVPDETGSKISGLIFLYYCSPNSF